MWRNIFSLCLEFELPWHFTPSRLFSHYRKSFPCFVIQVGIRVKSNTAHRRKNYWSVFGLPCGILLLLMSFTFEAADLQKILFSILHLKQLVGLSYTCGNGLANVQLVPLIQINTFWFYCNKFYLNTWSCTVPPDFFLSFCLSAFLNQDFDSTKKRR